MKLLIATGLYPPEIGGPATYTKLLEERLPAKGIEVRVLPFSLVRHLPSGVRHLAYAGRLLALARNVDIIFVQDTVSTGFPAALVSFVTRKPLVVRVPGDFAWEQGVQRLGVTDSIEEFQKKSYGIRIALLRAVQRFVVLRAAHVIAPSQYLARIVEGWGTPAPKMSVIYNGVDVSGNVGEREENLIVSVGRLVPWKGFIPLIDIVAKNSPWKLVILGDGPERKELEERVRDRGAADRITLNGAVSRDETHRWLSRASVFVLNSRYEGLSHTLLEACALGCPIVSTDAGGNPEVIRDEVDGVVIPHGNHAALERALVLLLGDARLRADYAAAARKRAGDFSIEATVEKTAALLSNIKDRPL